MEKLLEEIKKIEMYLAEYEVREGIDENALDDFSEEEREEALNISIYERISRDMEYHDMRVRLDTLYDVKDNMLS